MTPDTRTLLQSFNSGDVCGLSLNLNVVEFRQFFTIPKSNGFKDLCMSESNASFIFVRIGV